MLRGIPGGRFIYSGEFIMSEIILEMKNITKQYPGVLALDNVNFSVQKGEIHALVGENGAGKSTLVKVLSGVIPKGEYSGEMVFQGKPYNVRNIRQSEGLGITIIHQEFALSPHLSIAENIFLGNEIGRGGVIDWDKTRRKAMEITQEVGLNEDVSTFVKELGVGKKQLVEIAKALSKKVKLLILDEPTAALNEHDSENLLNLLIKLKNSGITSILISHKLNEVIKIADTLTILRDGKTIETLKEDEIAEERIIKGMVGRELSDHFPKRINPIGDVIFEIKNWSVHHPQNIERKIVHDVSLNVRSGEIVGLAGLMGAGRTEFAMSVFGKSYGANISGEIYLNGKKEEIKTVGKAIKKGIAYISEDRKGLGLILGSDIRKNITLPKMEKVSKKTVINTNEEILQANKSVDVFKIKCSSIMQDANNLSGGNQQKVVLAKWLFSESQVYIMDEPTRGIDVGAKQEVYGVINLLVAQGKAVILISSELPEILGICDRIYVMNRGRIADEIRVENTDQETIMKLLV